MCGGVGGVCVCLIVCDLETSTAKRSRPNWDCCCTEKKRSENTVKFG